LEKVKKVIWTENAKLHLKKVYDHHSKVNEELAFRLIERIIEKSESIVFPKQYQVDPYHSNYRRMIEGDYKILFRGENSVIYIMAIFPTKNNPKIIKHL
jgi:plasmid stabilization system protein ParE